MYQIKYSVIESNSLSQYSSADLEAIDQMKNRNFQIYLDGPVIA